MREVGVSLGLCAASLILSHKFETKFSKVLYFACSYFDSVLLCASNSAVFGLGRTRSRFRKVSFFPSIFQDLRRSIVS